MRFYPILNYSNFNASPLLFPIFPSSGVPPGIPTGMPPGGMMSTAPMKGVGPMPTTKTTTSKGRGKKKRNGSTSGPPPSTMGTSPGVGGYPGAAAAAASMGSAPGTPVRYPSPFQTSDPSMYNPSSGGPGGPGVNPMAGPPQPGPTAAGGPAVGTTGVPPNVAGTYPQGSQPPTSWYQGQQQQPMTAGGPQQTPLYSNTPYPRMPYMPQGGPPSEYKHTKGRFWN